MQLKRGIKQIHARDATETINNYTKDRVLGTHTPAIDLSEKELPHCTRNTLSQLEQNAVQLQKQNQPRYVYQIEAKFQQSPGTFSTAERTP